IVGRHSAVIFETNDLPNIYRRILRDLSIVTISNRHVEKSGFIERQSRSVARIDGALTATSLGNGSSGAIIRLRDEHVLSFGQRVATIPARAKDGGCSVHRICCVGLGIDEVDPVVLRKVRVQHDIEETAERSSAYLRKASDRIGLQHSLLYDTQTS